VGDFRFVAANVMIEIAASVTTAPPIWRASVAASGQLLLVELSLIADPPPRG
jgi:hypothetical protein